MDPEVVSAFGVFQRDILRLANLELRRRGALSRPELEDTVVAIKKAKIELDKKIAQEVMGAGGSSLALPAPGRMPRPRRLRARLAAGKSETIANIDEVVRAKWVQRFWESLVAAGVGANQEEAPFPLLRGVIYWCLYSSPSSWHQPSPDDQAGTIH